MYCIVRWGQRHLRSRCLEVHLSVLSAVHSRNFLTIANMSFRCLNCKIREQDCHNKRPPVDALSDLFWFKFELSGMTGPSRYVINSLKSDLYHFVSNPHDYKMKDVITSLTLALFLNHMINHKVVRLKDAWNANSLCNILIPFSCVCNDISCDPITLTNLFLGD